MITEDYVSFPVAKLLKEKGYDWPTNHYYYIDGKVHEQKNRHYQGRLVDRNIYSDQYSVPTQALACKWLREKHGIHINAHPVFEFNDGREDYLKLQGWQYWITVMTTDGKYDQEKSKAAIYNEPAPVHAIEAALLYTLQKLVK